MLSMTVNEIILEPLSEAAEPVVVPAQRILAGLGHNVGGSVGIIGLGYVGLPTAIAFAEDGQSVIGCDVSEDRLADIKAEAADLLETDRIRLKRHLGTASFVLTTNPASLQSADVVVVCVPTPLDSHLIPDLTALRAACDAAVRFAVPGQTVILTSTSYVGCTRELIVEPLAERGLEVGKDVFVAFSPERIDPGNSDHRQDSVPRIVGGVSAACRERAADAVRRITSEVHLVSSLEAAEAAKLLENTFRAVNIAFINEFADACRELSLEVVEVIQAAATKPFGFMPFFPGPGVGGHCIPCDPHYLLWQLRALRTRLPLTEAAMNAIATRPRQVAARAREVLLQSGCGLAGARVLMVGVTYKPGVRDVRESPALEIMTDLARHGVQVAYYDTFVPRLRLDGHELAGLDDPEADAWDLVIVHTLHPTVDHTWLERCPNLLDATYRASHLPRRALI